MSTMPAAALLAPRADGVKVTRTVQAAEGAMLAPVQVSTDLAKSAGLLPVRVILVTVRFAVPEFVIVTVCGVLVVFRF